MLACLGSAELFVFVLNPFFSIMGFTDSPWRDDNNEEVAWDLSPSGVLRWTSAMIRRAKSFIPQASGVELKNLAMALLFNLSNFDSLDVVERRRLISKALEGLRSVRSKFPSNNAATGIILSSEISALSSVQVWRVRPVPWFQH